LVELALIAVIFTALLWSLIVVPPESTCCVFNAKANLWILTIQKWYIRIKQ
jgi:hypothetical protein